jgi:hypothetical protein
MGKLIAKKRLIKSLSALYLLTFLIVAFQSKTFADEFPTFDVKALIDVRMALTDDAVSWLDDGLGKARYGGDENAQGQAELGFAEASVIMRSRFGASSFGKLHIKADPEQTHGVDIVEGFIGFRPVSTSATRFKARVGAFFPPISLENTHVAWTSPYSITPSAINSWVGEELRTLGAEMTVMHTMNDEQFSLTGSLFKVNDPAGSLLAWRGWALHDRKTGLFDRLPLAPLPSIEDGGSIQGQARWVEPFHELDGRTGYYVSANWKHDDIGQLQVMHYDNRADETAFDGDQYAWRTRFTAIGGRYEFENGIELLSQYMQGDSLMGRMVGYEPVVYFDFKAAYILLSKPFKQHRLSFRVDRFSVDDLDISVDDDNNENGSSITLAYILKVTRSQRLFVEAMQIESERANRSSIGLQPEQTENLLQVSYRFIF